jgi:hypothetical protein
LQKVQEASYALSPAFPYLITKSGGAIYIGDITYLGAKGKFGDIITEARSRNLTRQPLGDSKLPAEQPFLEGPRVEPIELEAPTKNELCSIGAVKLTHQNLAELKSKVAALQEELKVERQRTEALASRTATAETNLSVLRARTENSKGLTTKVRLLEVVILILLHYLSEATMLGELAKAAAMGLGCVILGVVIFQMQRGAPSNGE